MYKRETITLSSLYEICRVTRFQETLTQDKTVSSGFTHAKFFWRNVGLGAAQL